MAIAVHARDQGEAPAVTAPAGARTWASLNARANQLVRALHAAGLRSGDSVALVCSNRPEFAEVFAAVMRSGLRVTPINWHLTAQEIAYIVDNCDARALVGDARFAETLFEAGAQSPDVRLRLAVGGEIGGFDDYEVALAPHGAGDIPDPELGTQMLYTSGTTGHPKGVHRPAAAAARASAATQIARLAAYAAGKDVHLCTGPLYHAAPLAFSLLGPLNVGVHVVMMDGWKPERCLALIEEHRVTHSHMVPTMFHRLLALPEEVRARYDLSSLRFVVHGAAPCPVHVKQAMIDWLGPIVYEYYAATEGFGSLVTPEVWLERPGTVGLPPEGQVRVLGEDGEPVGPGQVGKLYLRAPEKGRFEYYKDAAKTEGAYRGDSGYFTLGDMGYVDEDGYLFLSDRSADVIISGGVNIYPAEVDAVLLTHPAVADAATVGAPNEEWGEEVRAVVTLREGHMRSDALEVELVAHCREHLAHYKCPKRVDFVEELPRHDTGKIYRRLVRERYWQGHEKKI
jgi:long-chain acyl-CoA synthetase